MTVLTELSHIEPTAIGREMHDFATELYPICRSITGDGIRQTLAKIGERVPLQTVEVPSGTPVFDWIVPKEWNVQEAYIADRSGRRVVDFRECNLHLMNYSTPIHTMMRFRELKPHLFTIPEYADWIPYRTSYYKEDWGFCLSHNQMLALDDQTEDEVCIDSS